MSQKSYDNTPSLYLIPTPIGNMDDITLRAVKTLSLVEVIFTEDTRVTGQLLNHLEIKKKLISSHQYNEEKNIDIMLDYLRKGYNIGLTTDRGTPVISDPGYILVKKAIENNFNVIALPGPTALIPALITSDIKPQPFIFYGFLNSKEEKRKKELQQIKEMGITTIIYESPHRLNKTLNNIETILENPKIAVSREISKKFEEIYRGQTSYVKTQLDNPKGEFVIVIDVEKKQNTFLDLTIEEHIENFIINNMSVKEAIKEVAKQRGISKSEVYKIYHKGDI